MENTMLRADGVPAVADIDDIDQRIQRAEYAAMHIVNNASLWKLYYEDRIEDNRLICDFKQLLRENKALRAKLSELEYEIESLGGKL